MRSALLEAAGRQLTCGAAERDRRDSDPESVGEELNSGAVVR
jgi:hypothetical protein